MLHLNILLLQGLVYSSSAQTYSSSAQTYSSSTQTYRHTAYGYVCMYDPITILHCVDSSSCSRHIVHTCKYVHTYCTHIYECIMCAVRIVTVCLFKATDLLQCTAVSILFTMHYHRQPFNPSLVYMHIA